MWNASSRQQSVDAVPTTLAAFPRWMAILRRWNRNWVDRGDGNAATNVPENVSASSPRAPNVSSLHCKWNKTVLIVQRCVFRSFAVLGVNGDCAGSNWRSMQVAYGQSVWTCEVPHQAPAVWPWHQCQAICHLKCEHLEAQACCKLLANFTT